MSEEPNLDMLQSPASISIQKLSEQRDSMKVVVMKFGGTCVESDASQQLVAERIMEAKDQGLQPVVVISAAGRMGQPYSTAELVATATRISPHIRPRELDLLMSCGEIISTVVMAHQLSAKGYDTIALTGGQAGLITDVYHGHARIVRIEPEPVLRSLQERKMVFVTGFQGVSERHAITTLGEGGSDYTAAALAVILSQRQQLPLGEELEMMPLQVFKDVDGVMTANPKNFAGCDPSNSGKLLSQLSFDECVEMSRLGADVFQHKAAQMARKHQLELLIRNFKKPEMSGTTVGSIPANTAEGKATAVADIPGLVMFTMKSDNPRLSGQLSEHFSLERLTHFMLAPEADEVRFAVKIEKYRDVVDIVERTLFMRGMKAEQRVGGWSLVSLAGERLRGEQERWKVTASDCLKTANVDVFGTIRGDLSVSMLISEDQRQKAVQLLHSAFVL
jgi:aspartate kinase